MEVTEAELALAFLLAIEFMLLPMLTELDIVGFLLGLVSALCGGGSFLALGSARVCLDCDFLIALCVIPLSVAGSALLALLFGFGLFSSLMANALRGFLCVVVGFLLNETPLLVLLLTPDVVAAFVSFRSSSLWAVGVEARWWCSSPFSFFLGADRRLTDCWS